MGRKTEEKIKRTAIVLALVFLTVFLAGCQRGPENTTADVEVSWPAGPAQTETAQETELIVFAAASMTETLTEIQKLYSQAAPHVTLVFNFDSSGTLKTQIEEGALCDVFISAAQKQMDQLDGAKAKDVNPQGLDFVLEGSRIDLLENKVVLVVPEGNPAEIHSFDDLAGDGPARICLGNDDVPVGQYSTEMLSGMGILDRLEADGKITYGSNVKEVTTQVSEAVVDCGIIYATDACAAGLTVVDEAAPGMCRPVIYPAAVLKSGASLEEARAFLEYLETPPCRAVFEEAGFSMAGQE
ncbi:MAG: molybdate ABC transporter substrate-binding protein [Lachnospiraceae bacterium]|nr:molybdate ABC transporter substrate-binding protein [Lachnospiraceae bacterium]